MSVVGLCAICGKSRSLKRHRQTGQDLCRTCQHKLSPPKKRWCYKCQTEKAPHRRTKRGHVCKGCSSTERYHDPATWKVCGSGQCGAEPKPVARNGPDGPRCHACYQRSRGPATRVRTQSLPLRSQLALSSPPPGWKFCQPCGKFEPDVQTFPDGVARCRPERRKHFLQQIRKYKSAS